jgi:hypothetical protein
MCPYIYFIMSNFDSKCSFHVAMLLCNVGHVWCHMYSYTIGMQFLVSKSSQFNDKCEEENWDHSI